MQQPRIIPGLDFTEEEVKWARERRVLLSFDLEITTQCNLKCEYCYRYLDDKMGERSINELSTEKTIEVIDQAIDMGARRACIIGGGEGLLRPKKYFSIINHLNELETPHVTFTNGTLITADLAKKLHKLQCSLALKLNSFIPDVQDRMAGVSGAHEKIAKSWQNLFNAGYCEADFPMVAFETVISRKNFSEIEKMWVWARESAIVPYVELITPQGRALRNKEYVSSDKCGKLFERLLQIDEERYGYTWNPTPPIASYHCSRHYMSATIDAEGFVKPCVGVDINVGNVKQTPLATIINNSRLFHALRNVDKLIKGSCRTCQYHEECYGCRGAAYHMLEDPFKSDPRCWLNPERVI